MTRYNPACAAFVAAVLALAGCGGGSKSHGGSGGGNPIPVVSPTGSASNAPVSEAAFQCPTSDTPASSARSVPVAMAVARHMPLRSSPGRAPAQPQATTLLAVTYASASASETRAVLAASEIRLGAAFKKEYDFPALGVSTRVVAVPSASVARTEATLRAQPGVRSVGLTGGRRYPLAVSFPYFTNDPYFAGFQNPLAVNGVTPPATYRQLPYAENADVPGQWGLHAARFDYAFEYSQPGNGSNVSNANALGSPGVKIAIVDSGADTSQTDLRAKIAYQRCFITDPNGVQSTSSFVTDPDGHGTDVSGIAGAVTNNGFAFAGAGGNSTLYEYRVDPTPRADCAPGDPAGAGDLQCTATTGDVVDAINDAVSRGVNVISLSLGSFASDGTSSGCSSGADGDQNEGNAINNALAKNVIVVAAAGNGGSAALSAPGCDNGVIAAGASALDDGQPNGAGNGNGSAAAPVEYVASYSSYGSPGAAFRNPAAWGIVAPGGDPDTIGNDGDNLHWIDDLWTSTPYASSDAGTCGPDYPFTTSAPTGCQTLIAGTSMSTPVVAGAAALILAVNNQYRVPSAMKQLLCSTADDIGDPHEGCGRLNIYRAMAVALGDPITP